MKVKTSISSLVSIINRPECNNKTEGTTNINTEIVTMKNNVSGG